jgi:hypothetical protein
MSSTKRLIFALSFCLIGLFSFMTVCKAQTVDVPVVNEIDGGDDGSFVRPIITGITRPGTEVLVYFDDRYTGTANTDETGGNWNDFYYEHPVSLSAGKHKFILIARDKSTYILSAPTSEYTINVEPVYQPQVNAYIPAPVLVQPNEDTITGKVKPVITGLSRTDTYVNIYIDGVFNGKTKLVSDSSGTANFSYAPFLNLDRGEHMMYAVSEDQWGRKSQRSEEIYFNIELPMPAPTLIKTVVNKNTTHNRPFITGVAKNDSLVKVYIDKKLDGEFTVKNDDSGTASFAHKPSMKLAQGPHIAYTTATDDRGKESSWSNVVHFKVEVPKAAAPMVSSISETGKEQEEASEISEPAKQESPKKEETKIKIEKNEINKILEEIKGTSTAEKTAQGSIDETKQSQSKTKLNLIIFLVFLVGVIAWIFWVNRELVKERKEQEKMNDQEKPKDSGGSNPSIRT